MRRFPESNDQLVEAVRDGARSYLGHRPRSERVLEALRRVDRAAFLPREVGEFAYYDEPVGIGFGQSCSQPSMVAFILDELDVRPGQRVLEVGAGCGYAAAIAALLCKPGPLIAVERIPELASLMKMRLHGAFPNVVAVLGDGSRGFPSGAPYDRIFLSAGVGPGFDRSPFIEQLTGDGVIVYPETLGKLTVFRKGTTGFLIQQYDGVRFVPLVGPPFPAAE